MRFRVSCRPPLGGVFALLLAGARVLPGAVQRGPGAAGGLVGAGARVAVVGDAVLDAGVLVETRHWYDTSWNVMRFNCIDLLVCDSCPS